MSVPSSHELAPQYRASAPLPLAPVSSTPASDAVASPTAPTPRPPSTSPAPKRLDQFAPGPAARDDLPQAPRHRDPAVPAGAPTAAAASHAGAGPALDDDLLDAIDAFAVYPGQPGPTLCHHAPDDPQHVLTWHMTRHAKGSNDPGRHLEAQLRQLRGRLAHHERLEPAVKAGWFPLIVSDVLETLGQIKHEEREAARRHPPGMKAKPSFPTLAAFVDPLCALALAGLRYVDRHEPAAASE